MRVAAFGVALWSIALGLPLGARADVLAGVFLSSPCASPQKLDTLSNPADLSAATSNTLDLSGDFSPCASASIPSTHATVTYSYDGQNSIASTAASSLAAAATVDLLGEWLIQLQPPPGGAQGTVTVGAASTYSLNIAGASGPGAVGEARFTVALAGTSPTFGFNILEANSVLVGPMNGQRSGLLQTGDATVKCCLLPLDLLLFGTLGVANGASGSLNDPPSLILPTGWTYSLTPEPVPLSVFQMFVPEPSTALLLSAGLMGLAVRRHARGASVA